MKKSLLKKIKITQRGKIKRRPQGLGHARVNKNRKQVMRKRKSKNLDYAARIVRKNFF